MLRQAKSNWAASVTFCSLVSVWCQSPHPAQHNRWDDLNPTQVHQHILLQVLQ